MVGLYRKSNPRINVMLYVGVVTVKTAMQYDQQIGRIMKYMRLDFVSPNERRA